MGRNILLGYFRLAFLIKLVESTTNLSPDSVIEAEIEIIIIVLGLFFSDSYFFLNIFGKSCVVTDGSEADILLVLFSYEVIKINIKYTDDSVYFLIGSLPVFRREGIGCNGLYAGILEVVGDFLKYLCTLFVPRISGQIAFCRPSAVAVKNEGNMLRHFFRVRK